MNKNVSLTSEFTHKPVSQRYLIWKRFTRHRLGVIGGIIMIFMVFIFAFAEFVAPYEYLVPHRDTPYVSPMITRIHWDGISPYVYGMKRVQAFVEYNGNRIALPGVFNYEDDLDNKYYIRLFVPGEEYKLMGWFKGNVHLFGLQGTEDLKPSERKFAHFFPLGTDQTGRDLFSQILVGGRITLGLAPLVILVSFLVGTFVGGFSGYLGGGWDTFIQRITEIFMSLPRLALILTISGLLATLINVPPMMRFWSIVGLLSLIGWAPLARVVRGQFLALREHEFTQAARALGASNGRIIFRQIMPNIMSYLVVASTLAIPDIIILESILSFLGYGIQNPLMSWGYLLNAFQGQGFLTHMEFHPWLLIPAFFIIVSVLALNFLGDALRDAYDPFNVTGASAE